MEETTYKVIAPYYGLKVGNRIKNAEDSKLSNCFRTLTIIKPRRSEEISQLEEFAEGTIHPLSEMDPATIEKKQIPSIFLNYLYRKNILEKIQRWKND